MSHVPLRRIHVKIQATPISIELYLYLVVSVISGSGGITLRPIQLHRELIEQLVVELNEQYQYEQQRKRQQQP
jgi:hypothetical protein